MKGVVLMELSRLRKNGVFFLYASFFLLGFTAYAFLIHVTRIGDSGNPEIPLSVFYASYVFLYAALLPLVLLLRGWLPSTAIPMDCGFRVLPVVSASEILMAAALLAVFALGAFLCRFHLSRRDL